MEMNKLGYNVILMCVLFFCEIDAHKKIVPIFKCFARLKCHFHRSNAVVNPINMSYSG